MGRKKKNTVIKKSTKSKTHLTEEERITIQTMLDNRASPYTISKTLGKSASTITREIEKHVRITEMKNDCINYNSCNKKRVSNMQACRYCNKYCKGCSVRSCTKMCSDYVKTECEYIVNSPHVCNGCDLIHKCQLEHRIYSATFAQKMYEAQLTDKRIGFDLTEEELKVIDKMVTPLIKAGHSPYAVVKELENDIPVSKATLYRLIDSGLLECRNIDLQEKVKRKVS